MKARHIYNSWVPKFMGVTATMVYPFIFYKREKSKITPRLHNHEMIHIWQVRERNMLLFYLSYGLYYLAGRIKGEGHWEAYRNIPYEVEAYDNDQNLKYLDGKLDPSEMSHYRS